MRSPAREGGGLVWSGRGKQTSRGGALTRCNVRRTGPVRTSKESESAKGAQTGTLKEGRGHCRTCNRVQWNPCRIIIIAVVTVFGEDVDMGCHCKGKGVASTVCSQSWSWSTTSRSAKYLAPDGPAFPDHVTPRVLSLALALLVSFASFISSAFCTLVTTLSTHFSNRTPSDCLACRPTQSAHCHAQTANPFSSCHAAIAGQAQFGIPRQIRKGLCRIIDVFRLRLIYFCLRHVSLRSRLFVFTLDFTSEHCRTVHHPLRPRAQCHAPRNNSVYFLPLSDTDSLFMTPRVLSLP